MHCGNNYKTRICSTIKKEFSHLVFQHCVDMDKILQHYYLLQETTIRSLQETTIRDSANSYFICALSTIAIVFIILLCQLLIPYSDNVLSTARAVCIANTSAKENAQGERALLELS